MDQANTHPFPFLALPSEIRNKIYRYLLSTKHTKRVLTPGPEEDVSLLVKLCPSHIYEFQTNVLGVSRQVYREATAIFYGENLFIAFASNFQVMPYLLAKVGLKPVSHGRRAGVLKRRMRIAMTIAYSWNRVNSNATYCYAFACEDLHLLCRGFLAIGMDDLGDIAFLRSSSFQVSICRDSGVEFPDLRDSTPSASSASCRLLEPFTKLHSIGNFSITGPVNEQYKNHIIKQVKCPAPNHGSVIAEISALKDDGNVAYCNHQDGLAISKYEAAFIHLQTTFWNYDIIQQGEFTNMTSSDVSCVLYYRLHSDLDIALQRVGRLDDCRYWARHTRKERSVYNTWCWQQPPEIWMRPLSTVLACRAVGEIERAVFLLRNELKSNPGNVTLMNELAILEIEAAAKKARDPVKYKSKEADAISGSFKLFRPIGRRWQMVHYLQKRGEGHG
ncbi:MAG: hypothetical protein Q9161_003406 [Pseudevernia consocians]